MYRLQRCVCTVHFHLCDELCNHTAQRSLTWESLPPSSETDVNVITSVSLSSLIILTTKTLLEEKKRHMLPISVQQIFGNFYHTNKTNGTFSIKQTNKRTPDTFIFLFLNVQDPCSETEQQFCNEIS